MHRLSWIWPCSRVTYKGKKAPEEYLYFVTPLGLQDSAELSNHCPVRVITLLCGTGGSCTSISNRVKRREQGAVNNGRLTVFSYLSDLLAVLSAGFPLSVLSVGTIFINYPDPELRVAPQDLRPAILNTSETPLVLVSSFSSNCG